MTEPRPERLIRQAREAEGYYELELFEEALQRAEGLLDEPDVADFAKAMRAECLRSLGRWGEAAAAFEEIIRDDPEEVSAYVGLGWCHKRSDRLDLAMQAMERLLSAVPHQAIGLFNLACYCCLAGERDRALRLLAESIDEEEHYRELAAAEEDFAPLEDDEEFRRIVDGGGEK